MSMIYRYFDSEGLKATIKARAIRLAKITALNDPFDFNPQVKLKEVTIDELRKIYQRSSDKHKINVDKRNDSELQLDWSSRETNFTPSTIKKLASQYFGIISLSRLWDNPLLWAHYAEKHQGGNIGFCIEHPPFSLLKKRNLLVNVKYQKDRPILYYHPFDRPYFRSQFQSAVRIKANIWQYENEVRAILPIQNLKGVESILYEDNGYFYLRIKPNEWREIRFGIYTKTSIIQEVMDIAKEIGMTECHFYKAYLEKHNFNIMFKLLN